MNAYLKLPIDLRAPPPPEPREPLPIPRRSLPVLADRAASQLAALGAEPMIRLHDAAGGPSAPNPKIDLIPRAHGAPPPRSVRVSVTDRCDFACTYCRPSHSDGYAEGRLQLSVWRTMFEGLKSAGVQRVRLTGGEPLIHPEIIAIVGELASIGFEDIALTTNASQLARLAKPLAAAGLHRINISIDTLDPERFRAVTRGGDLAKVR